jgi:UDP-N-acetylglucosamine 4,6-dehydratase
VTNLTNVLDSQTVLVTGGTGSFGNKFTEVALAGRLKKLIVFSRDEWKQGEMATRFTDRRMRFFLGDVRDESRLRRAFEGVDVVVHAAALKQVPALEYNPFEAIQTNVIGAHHVINAALDTGVKKVVAVSTDKAVNPVNLYGASKLCAEKLFTAANVYASGRPTRFSVVRYGNVVGSRGSVVPLFLQRRATGVLPITDERMTRFWITLEQGVALVLRALAEMLGGEVFVPKVPSMRIVDVARALAPECRHEDIGMRPGEKIHEVLLTEDEAPRSLDMGRYFVITPNQPAQATMRWNSGEPVAEGFRYSSDSNTEWLGAQELAAMIKELA